MKAAHINQNGGIDCLTVGEVPDPKPGKGEVLVQVKTAALNHLDIWIRKGRPGAAQSMPHVLGSDAMGTIAEFGPDAAGLNVGDSVILNPGLSCGRCEFCLRGEQSECPTFGIVGAARWGTFAEFVAVPACNVHPVPEHLTPEEAAALPLAYLTAWRMLFSRARLRAGETLLIHGIGGGVALAGLQLATLTGAFVIVTSGDEEKLERARELGASGTVNYKTSQGVADEVKAITHGRGVDVILDTVGASTWPINFAAARRGGRIVHCGVTSGKTVEVDISALYWNHLTILGSTMGSNEEFRQLLAAVNSTRLKPIIDSILPLDEAKDAMNRMEEGQQFGKIVLEVAP